MPSPTSETPRSTDAKRRVRELKTSFIELFPDMPINCSERQTALEFGQSAGVITHTAPPNTPTHSFFLFS